ncbi:MAG: carboxypeptidase regulatory-like domain-containing protein [Kofleriaceae bacterium]|nr:carboxypeptidase regulatory-like domain-containing protein [Kofleriaceae bacterium]
MIRALSIRLGLGLGLALAAMTLGCGAEGAGPRCEIAVQFDPLDAVAPRTIVARSTVTNTSGVLAYGWSVRRGGLEVPTTPRTTDGRDVEFAADQPGVYEVQLDVDGDPLGCPTWTGDKNVRDASTTGGALRLRFSPPREASVPVQERVVDVPGGADFATGVLAIDPGIDAPIAVHDLAGAAVPAYVRLTSRATPDATVEIVTSAGGGERVALASGRYDALIIPLIDGLAPAQIDGWAPVDGAFTIDAGATVAGRVLDAGGAPLAGARVSITAGDQPPSSVAITAAAGTFALAWRPGAGAALIVVPPAATGLPRLTAPLAGLATSQPLTVRYQPGHPTVDLGDLPVGIAGAPVADGHVLIALELGDVATVGDGTTTAPARGHHRDQVATDGAGRLAPYRATVGSGRAFAVGPTGAAAVALIDLAAPPAAIDAPGPAALTGTVTDRGGAPLAGVALTATVDGDLAHLGAPRASAISGADGRFALAVAGGATYQIELRDPRAVVAPRLITAAGAAGDLGAIALPPAIRVRGTLRLVGQSVGLPDVGVSARCEACAGLERSRPLGTGVTDVAGDFAVVIPDPGAPP